MPHEDADADATGGVLLIPNSQAALGRLVPPCLFDVVVGQGGTVGIGLERPRHPRLNRPRRCPPLSETVARVTDANRLGEDGLASSVGRELP